MTIRNSIFAFGQNRGTRYWEEQCKLLGHSMSPIMDKPRPQRENFINAFKEKPHWIYFGGHHYEASGVSTLANDKFTTKLKFDKGFIKAMWPGNSLDFHYEEPSKNKPGVEFNLNANCELIVFAGCDLFYKSKGSRNSLKLIHQIFKKPLILGFNETTNFERTHLILGGKWGIKKPGNYYYENDKGFFQNIKNGQPPHEAWINAGINAKRFIVNALMPDGQIMGIHSKDKKIFLEDHI